MTSEMKFSELVITPSTVPGWSVKACVGLFCIGLLALYLPLGVLGLGLLIYISLILRVTAQPESHIRPDETVYAPVDGRSYPLMNVVMVLRQLYFSRICLTAICIMRQ